MNTSKPHIALLLLLVYALSMALTATPSFSFAGIEVKRECPNKAARKAHVVSLSAGTAAGFIAEAIPKGMKTVETQAVVKVCTSSVVFLPMLPEEPVAGVAAPPTPAERPLFFDSPHLLKVIDPPRST